MCSTRSPSPKTAPKTTPPRLIVSLASAVNTPPEEEQARTCSSLCCAPSVSGLCASRSLPTGQRFSHRSHEMHSAASTAG